MKPRSSMIFRIYTEKWGELKSLPQRRKAMWKAKVRIRRMIWA